MESETTPPRLDEGSWDVTCLLLACGEGDRVAFDRLVPLIYGELHQIARHQLRRLRPGDTLGTTGLVHEVYLKLVDQKRAGWRDRKHFFSIAARAMRQILVDYARSRQTEKRGGGATAVPFDEARATAPESDEAWLLELNAAVARLEELDPRLPRVVECLFFAGFTQEETAEALGVSPRTVQRDWQRARAWLQEELGEAPVDQIASSHHARAGTLES